MVRQYVQVTDAQRRDLVRLIHEQGYSIAKASKATSIPYDNAKAINRTYLRERRVDKIDYQQRYLTAKMRKGLVGDSARKQIKKRPRRFQSQMNHELVPDMLQLSALKRQLSLISSKDSESENLAGSEDIMMETPKKDVSEFFPEPKGSQTPLASARMNTAYSDHQLTPQSVFFKRGIDQTQASACRQRLDQEMKDDRTSLSGSDRDNFEPGFCVKIRQSQEESRSWRGDNLSEHLKTRLPSTLFPMEQTTPQPIELYKTQTQTTEQVESQTPQFPKAKLELVGPSTPEREAKQVLVSEKRESRQFVGSDRSSVSSQCSGNQHSQVQLSPENQKLEDLKSYLVSGVRHHTAVEQLLGNSCVRHTCSCTAQLTGDQEISNLTLQYLDMQARMMGGHQCCHYTRPTKVADILMELHNQRASFEQFQRKIQSQILGQRKQSELDHFKTPQRKPSDPTVVTQVRHPITLITPKAPVQLSLKRQDSGRAPDCTSFKAASEPSQGSAAKLA